MLKPQLQISDDQFPISNELKFPNSDWESGMEKWKLTFPLDALASAK